MQFLKICVFLLCAFMLTSWINATPYNYYQAPNVGRFGGSAFGEGVLRPGSDTGEGIFSELDAPSYSPPNTNRYNIYNYQ
ncbi:uncharacterized protein Dvir_GJ26398 [Drosophila virilis]|uniref:Uncharacterized protein n=1 Tax=Drosophila virilis TaxID=7244 RepID=A0A0Q9WTA5_DROVI|nr:uncharacterized protein Dvir_GJ26398 [Drosophila virilis]